MPLEFLELEKELQTIIAGLRNGLALRDMSFGALFVGIRNEGFMIVLAETMPAELRISMLTYLISAAHETIEHYRKAS